VALVSAASTFPDFARATDPRGPIPARPGINPLRLRTTYVVPREDLDRLRALARALGGRPPDSGDRLDFAGAVFAAGDTTTVSTEADPADVAAIAAQVRQARSSSDHTIVSIHCHETEGLSRESPPAFLAAFARAMIDAGADAVVGHGPHVLRGIEIYRGKPILYSLGNFLFQYETVSELPSDDYDAVDLPATARPDDFFDRYDQRGARGYPSEREVWESAVAILRFRGPRLDALELYPIALGFGLPRGERGRPRLADADVAREIIHRLARLSRPFGTEIDFDATGGGIGRVRIPPD
jgi:poly-gamma-glutamate synthesis protein (capsule biosynthesis protein)